MQNFIKIVVISSLFFMMGLTNIVLAADDWIDVSYSGSKIFNEKNVYPGWSKKEKFSVKNNHPTDEADLYITFDLKDGKTLADVLKVYVIRADGSYRLGGRGDRFTLKDLDRKGRVFIDKLKPGEREDFKMKIEFDKRAGNEHQNKSSKFDVKFKIEGDLDSQSNTVREILNREGRRGFTGEEPAVVAGAQDKNKENGDGKEGGSEKVAVAGVKNENNSCQGGWPLWAWILILTIGGIGIYFANKTTKKSTRIAIQLLIILSIGILWFYKDHCRTYKWLPYVDSLGGIVLIGMLQKRNKEMTELVNSDADDK